jgi:FlaA1/EpsC-like NDP-sugar epimerase
MFDDDESSRLRLRLVTRSVLRTVLVAAADAVCVAAAVQLGMWLRFDMNVPGYAAAEADRATLFAATAQLAIGALTGIYVRHYRPASFDEALGLAKTTVATVALTALANETFLDASIPRSVSLSFGVLALFLMSVVRWIWRADQERRIRRSSSDAPPLIVVGAGEAGTQIVRQLLRTTGGPFRPVAILDDDPGKLRLQVHGLPVSGSSVDLAATARRTGATTVLFAVPSAGPGALRQLSTQAAAAGLQVLVLPSIDDLFGDDVALGDIRPLAEEDLLGRGETDIDIDAIADYLTGRTVLVTGAGGSIGSELCRQVTRFAPANLVMLDRDESALHGVELSITGRATLDHRNLVVCDIRDADRLDEVFAEHRPDVVFHAAALKHLPLLEMHPSEAVKSNCTGTLNVLRAATDHGVGRFVNISTDKAADPTSTLGRTKRIAERITSHWSRDHAGTFLSVRFGNVLGSRGSVLTTFRSQVASGGPITVTHPEVTRFFMTIEEAVRLVIQAGALDLDGHALVLDMGEPVKIDDVARRLAATGERPIEVVYTGLRPGEKLHEQLIADDEVGVRTQHPLITEVPVPPLDPAGLVGLRLRAPLAEITEQLTALLHPPEVATPAPTAIDAEV